MHGMTDKLLNNVAKLPRIVGVEPECVFHADWWAEAASPGQWSKITCRRDHLKVAEFTFSHRKRAGGVEIGHPFMARTMEPRIWLPAAKPITQLTNLVSILGEIREQLPRHDLFWYNLPPGNALELPYELAGYSVENSYTFRSLHDEDLAWESMDSKTRNRVRTAQKTLEIDENHDIEAFIELSKRFVTARSRRNSVDYEAVRRIFAACTNRNQACIFTAKDAEGEALAAAIIVWDHQTSYFWMSARDPANGLGSAVSLLIWHAIQWSIRRRITFDLDGFASAAAGIFYAKFGLVPARRAHVRWASPAYKLKTNGLAAAKKLLQRR